MSPRPSSMPNRNRPGSRARSGSAWMATIQFGHPRPHIGQPADPAGQRGGDDIAHPFVGGRGQQPGRGRRVGDGRRIPHRAQLQIAPHRQLQSAVAELGRRVRQRFQLSRGDHPAGQPQPGQRAVGGLVHLQGTGARVVVAHSLHPSTVRAYVRAMATAATPRVGIIGAGMSGLCMAMKLQDAGIDSFVIYEQADDVGGTWRDNTYPGLHCDIPSPFYSYSFFPNAEWSRMMPPGGEIQQYLRRVADERGIRRHIRFGTEVTAARYEDGRWQLTTDSGDDECDVLITATGFLRVPRMADIPGRDSFAGTGVSLRSLGSFDHPAGQANRPDRDGLHRRSDRRRARWKGQGSSRCSSAPHSGCYPFPNLRFTRIRRETDPQISGVGPAGVCVLVLAHLVGVRPRADPARPGAKLLPPDVLAEPAPLGARPDAEAQADPETIRRCANAWSSPAAITDPSRSPASMWSPTRSTTSTRGAW